MFAAVGTNKTNVRETSDHPFDILPNAPTSTPTQTTPPFYTPAPPATPQPTGNNYPGLAGTATYDSWNQGLSSWTGDIDPNSPAAAAVVRPGPNVPPLLVRVQAVQIRIRIWDPKYQGARQVTIVQDL
jgi:hypothetical protein